MDPAIFSKLLKTSIILEKTIKDYINQSKYRGNILDTAHKITGYVLPSHRPSYLAEYYALKLLIENEKDILFPFLHNYSPDAVITYGVYDKQPH